ncbi:MAG: NAD(P)-dependent oxidoreductase [Proteobacteria bacterium]|nr:NAD(P)-dependent oxidoreductase [Pseudomonadota bacterium]
MRVGFIGLGNMGSAQAAEIARAGFELTVYDAFARTLDAFTGGTRAGSPAEVASGCDIIGICVRDDPQVREVIFGAKGLAAAIAPGALVLVHSTVSPATIRAAAEGLHRRGAALIDAAVTRTRYGTAAGPFVLSMTGGDPALTERARPVLAAFSTEVVHAGPLGAGMALKIANNFVTWSHILVIKQALALAHAGGVGIGTLRAVMKGNGNLTAVTAAVMDGAERDAGGMSPERRDFLESQGRIGEKDLALALEMAQAAGVDLSMGAQAARDILEAMQR